MRVCNGAHLVLEFICFVFHFFSWASFGLFHTIRMLRGKSADEMCNRMKASRRILGSRMRVIMK